LFRVSACLCRLSACLCLYALFYLLLLYLNSFGCILRFL
jgi:hypothetical protein